MAAPRKTSGTPRSLPWLPLALALLALGAFVAIQLADDYKRTVNWERERLQNQARMVAANLSRQLEATHAALVGIRSDLGHWRAGGDLPAAVRRFKALIDAMPGVRTFLITDADGVAEVSNRDELIGKNFSYREYFLTTMMHNDQNLMVVTPPFVTELNAFAMTMAMMVFGTSGEFSGIVSATVDYRYFITLLQSVVYADDMQAGLAHGDGVQFVMVPEGQGQAGRALDRPGSAFSRHRDAGVTESVFQEATLGAGDQRMVVVRTIKPASVSMDKPLILIVSRDLGAVLAAWRADALRQGGLYLLLVVVSVLGTVLFQRRQKAFDLAAGQARQALMDSAERLALATSAAGVGVWEYDPSSGAMAWDTAMHALFGQEEGTLTPSLAAWSRRVVPEDADRLGAALREAMDSGRLVDTSFAIRRGDGQIRSLRITAKSRRPGEQGQASMVGTCEDITERRRDQQALQDRERFLRTITDAIPGLIGYWDRDMRCAFANAGYLSWFGRTSGQMIGLTMREVMGETLFEQNLHFIQAALGGERQQFERAVNRPGGATSWAWVQYIPDIDQSEVRGFFVLATDITALKLAQTALEDANRCLEERTAQAESANRAKGDFLANMSHEIRTPMNAILGAAHLLGRTPLSSEQRNLVSTLAGSGRALLALIDDILDFSRVESGRLRLEQVPFSLLDVLESVAALMAVTAGGKGLELVVGAEEDVPGGVVGDPLRLRQVLINLVGNAIKFTERGEVVVHAERLPDGPGVGAAEAGAGAVAHLRFSVRDTGIGIEPGDIPRLFEKFTQADGSTTRRFGGSGLGLAICKHLVTLMGGEMQVESQPGQGSLFAFTVPLPVADVPARPAATARMESLRVLIADDHPLSRKVLAQVVRSLGWEASSVASGAQAVEQVHAGGRQGAFCDVVLMDWHMPGLDGLEASRRIRAGPRNAPSPIIIMMSAHNREELLARAEAGLVDAVLTKPVTGSVLYNAVVDARLRRGEMPCVPEEPAAEKVAGRLEGVRILLVEDNVTNQAIEGTILRQEGARVTLAGNGAQALAALAAAPDSATDAPDFDIVFMDMQMPVMDGYEATRRIRASVRLCKLPVVALTAGVMNAERELARAAGLSDFVSKPFEVEQIIQVICQHVPRCRREAAAAKPSASLPSSTLMLPGVDVPQALLRVGGGEGGGEGGGGEALFLSLLAHFVREHRNAAAEVRTMLAEERAKDAAHCVHSLCGAAANLAVVRVATLALALEDSMKSNEAEKIASLLEALETALAQLATAMAALESGQ